jgi:hypothetical protein
MFNMYTILQKFVVCFLLHILRITGRRSVRVIEIYNHKVTKGIRLAICIPDHYVFSLLSICNVVPSFKLDVQIHRTHMAIK